MGVSIFPIIEGDKGEDKLRHLLKPVEWKTLSDCTLNQVLMSAAEALDLTPLDEFMSTSREDALEDLGAEEVEEYEQDAELRDGAYDLDGGLLWTLEKQWFEPRDGMKTVRGLLEWMERHPQAPNDEEPEDPDFPGAKEYSAPEFTQILRELESVLAEAATANRRFYLACNG